MGFADAAVHFTEGLIERLDTECEGQPNRNISAALISGRAEQPQDEVRQVGVLALERRQGSQVPMRPYPCRDFVRVLGKILYWLAVLAVSLALLIVLVLFFESRDESQVENGAAPVERV